MVVHDGFTLNDLYSCNGPNNNQPWPYGPSDGGSSTNYSWDQNGTVAAQRAAARVGFALLMLSAGTPLMTGGDEYLRSLHCNNNPYNDDSIANWLNYSRTSDQSNFNAFVQGMIAFRKAHAALRPLNFYSTAQLLWWTPAGTTARRDLLQQWDQPCHRLSVDRQHTRRQLFVHLCRLQRLEWQREFHAAVARQRHELVPRHRYLQLGRGRATRYAAPGQRTRLADKVLRMSCAVVGWCC